MATQTRPRGCPRGTGWILLAAVVAAGCADTSAPPKPKAPPPPVVKVSDEARAVLERMKAFLAGKKGISFRQTSTTTAANEALGAKIGGTMEHAVLLERPGRFRLRLAGDRKGGGTVVSDGTTLVVHQDGPNRYESAPVPESLAGILENPLVAGMMSIGGGEAVLRAILADDPGAVLLDGVSEIAVEGSESVDGRQCTHLVARSGSGDWDLWIAEGDEPVPVKFSPRLNKMTWGGELVDVATTVTVGDWAFDPAFNAEEFAFSAPEGAEKVDSILAAAEEDSRRRAAGRPSLHPTVGFPAPAAALVGIDGGRFDPAGQKDKIVVLDFWASWCGPCRASLPTVAALCAEYADKGVVFRAVNCKEDAETVKRFLEEESLAADVVIDPTGETMAAYRVEAIPHTVVIGKDGLVQAVHVGASEGFDAKLRRQLDAVLEGKSLVPQGGNSARAEPL